LSNPAFPSRRRSPAAATLALAALAVIAAGARLSPLAAQTSHIVQTDAGPCDLAPPPRAAAKATGGEQGELLPSVEIPESAEARLAHLKASALFAAPTERWVDPPEIKRDRIIDTTLRIAYAKNKVNGQDVHLRSYLLPDGRATIPAPTFRFQGSDVERHLRVLVKNDLPCNGGKPGDPTCKPTKCTFHGHEHADPNNPANFRLNDTNLHVHGLHVSPRPPQDDVLLTVEPGCQYQVDVRIPKDHLAGTGWYHPHQHGSTALQLASGMAGALILEGDIDRVPEVQAAKEKVFVFQQLSYDPATGTSEDFKKLDRNWNAKKITLINGQVKPLIVLRRGEVQRWRFINAGFFEVLPIRLAVQGRGAPLHVIAVDGITLPRRRPVERVDLAPGNRADVMVKLDEVGNYYLYKSESMRQNGVLDESQILAQVDVVPETKEMKLPDVLPGDRIQPIDETAAKPRSPLYFSARRDERLNRLRFIVNGRDFDPMRVDQTLKLGATEEWTVFNCTDQDHPFHIHVNPFQVSEYTTPDGQTVRISDPKQRPWHDTFLIPKGRKVTRDGKEVIIPGHFKLLTRYDDFDGRFVLHCHILTHEDQGMMQLIDIVK
jgi:FtsP/CotA-like multicopper oxidase with cupredoxin domain